MKGKTESATIVFHLRLLFTMLLALVLVCIGSPETATAQTFGVLHTFTGGSDGAKPVAGLTMDSAGNMYGTAEYGGETFCYLGCGTVFQLKRQGSQWTFNVIYTFQGGADGQNPKARVVFGPDGTLYGTTTSSEDPQIGGTLFNLKPPATCWNANCQWTKTVLNTFNPTECVLDYDNYTCLAGDLTFDSAGNIYGTTAGGGQWDEGTVFKLIKTNNGWVRTTLYSFLQTSSQRPDGMNPFSGVVFDKRGNLWGTTYTGGGSGGDDPGYGVVFELTPAGQGWSESIRVINGAELYGGLIFDSAGLGYVGAYAGGTGTCLDWEPPYAPGCGTVVRSSGQSSQWITLQNIQQIGRDSPQPGGPMQPLALDAAGNVYGANYRDPYGAGTVFELMAGTWNMQVLHQFNAGTDGANPISNIIFDDEGILYGTASTYGQNCTPLGNGCGVIWTITP
jgi:hypothetical protein